MIDQLASLNLFWLTLIGVVSVARFARLWTHDTFPPMEWARPRIAGLIGPKWEPLMVCPFCVAPYLMAGQIVWFSLLHDESATTFAWGWVIPNLWWALSYVAAIIVAYDQPEE